MEPIINKYMQKYSESPKYQIPNQQDLEPVAWSNVYRVAK